jgi:hypothetical protein
MIGPMEQPAELDYRFRRLRVANGALALTHAGQALVILLLSNDFSLPVTGSFLSGQPGKTGIGQPSDLFELPVGPAVAVFLLLAAVDHGLTAAPTIVRWYERSLMLGINPARWIEYSLSASLMVVLIAMLTGVSDIGALIAIFGVNSAMILFGWLMERFNDQQGDVDWLPFTFGSLAGAVPWIVIAVAIIGSEIEHGGPPEFVYGIFVTLFVLYFSFAVNQFLQYQRIGPWRDYLFGEWGYLVLSLTAKSLLAWQIFANTLV